MTKKTLHRSYEFYKHVYPLKLYICTSTKAYKDLCKEIGAKPDNDGMEDVAGLACSRWDKDKNYCIFLVLNLTKKDRTKTSKVIEVVSHEAIHILRIINNFIGEHNPGAEADAYFTSILIKDTLVKYNQDIGKIFND